jgi:predicted ATPase/transcriptional regulator with XRE-family HTH domain
MAGCSVQMIRKLEAGDARPSPDLAVRITHALVPSPEAGDEAAGPPFALWLRRQRQALLRTQAELADQAGCSISTIKRLEQGRLRPSQTLATKLAQVLEIPQQDRPAWIQRAREPAGAAEVPGPIRRTNLPPLMLSPIGRNREMARAGAALTREQARLVTLTGPAGIGKTRLALYIASGLEAAFPDGIWWVPLASLADPALLETTISRALELHDGTGPPAVARLRSYLRPRRLLLVLDNFEHLLTAAPVLADLLAGAPGLRLLATSQAPLGLAGELVLTLPPLAVPPLAPLPPLPDLPAYPAMQLFLQEALAADAAFQLTPDNAALLVEICRRLDGLPLAIELAAARSRRYSPAAMLAGLDQPLDFLTAAESGDRPPRHQALRQALAWSTNLLQAADQVLFAGLGIFAGGATLEAVESLLPPLLEAALLPRGGAAAARRGLEHLLTHHLVLQEGEDGATRFTLLDTVRAFAREQLQARNLLAPAAAHHAHYYLAQAEQESDTAGAITPAGLDRLEQELDNYRAALDWTLAAPDRHPLAARLALALVQFWEMRGYWQEGQRWLMRILAQMEPAPDPLTARLEYHAGRLAHLQGEYATAEPLLQRSLAAGRRHIADPTAAWAANALGWMAYSQGHYHQARAYYEQGLAAARATDTHTAAAILNGLGAIALMYGDRPAEPLLQEGLALRQAVGDQQGIARSFNMLGLAAQRLSDYPQAIRHFQACLTIARTLGDKLSIALALNNLGWVSIAAGDLAEAQIYLAAALGQAREVGSPLSSILALCSLGWLAIYRGTPEQAAALLAESLAGTETHGMSAIRVICYLGQALLAIRQHDTERASRLFDQAETLRRQLSLIPTPHMQQVALEIAQVTGRPPPGLTTEPEQAPAESDSRAAFRYNETQIESHNE